MTKPYRWYKGEPVIMKKVYYIGNQMFTRLEHFYTKEVIPAVDVHDVKDTREESLEIASDLQEEPKQEEQKQVNKIKFTDVNGNENAFEENSKEYQKFVDDNKLKDEFIERVLDGKINKHKGFNIERV